MKIEAAKRLNAVQADETMARKFIESLGITPGRKQTDEDGFIGFTIEDAHSAKAKNLTEARHTSYSSENTKRHDMAICTT